MLDKLVSRIRIALDWVRSGINRIADVFWTISNYAEDIPLVGGYLSTFFSKIATFFDDLANDIKTFSMHVADAFDTVSYWLENIPNIINDINGWISDKLDSAYTWARDAIDTVADILDDVNDLVYEVFIRIPKLFTAIQAKVSDLLYEVFTSIPQKLSALQDMITAPLETLKQEILQIFAPTFNLISLFFDDIKDFFSDPAEYFAKKLERLGTPFAERMWDFIEKILEKIW